MRAFQFIFLLSCLLLAGACRARQPDPPQPPAAAVPPAEQWLDCRAGHLQPGPPPGAAGSREPVAFLPWTVQARVADLARWNGAVYLAVNGQGLVRLEGGAPVRLAEVSEPLFFRGRTVTALLPREGELLCHLYFNSLLNVSEAERLKVQGISLLRLRPGRDAVEVLPVPSQQAEPEWEAVGFLPDGSAPAERLLFEWKTVGTGRSSGDRQTRFRYSAFHPGTGREEPVRREDYLQAYGFLDLEDRSVSAGLRTFLRSVRQAALPAGDLQTALHLILRTEGSPVERRYEHRPAGYLQVPDPRLETVFLYRNDEQLYALLPDGTLLKADRAGGRPERLALPGLPPGYRYGRFLARGSWVAAAWEQVRFFEVGAAGLLIRDFSR